MLSLKRVLSMTLAILMALSIIPHTMPVAYAENEAVTALSSLNAAFDAQTGQVTVSELPSASDKLILAGYQEGKMVFAEVTEELTADPVNLNVPDDAAFDTLKVFCLDSTGKPLTEAELVYPKAEDTYSIDHVAFSDETGQFAMRVTASMDCVLTLQFQEETTKEVLYADSVTVSGADTQQTVAYKPEADVLPDTFLLTLALVDEDEQALCEPYSFVEKTQSYREAMKKTIDDFESDRVLKLDEAKDNNFMVAAEDTQILELSAAYTIETDENTGVITIRGDVDALGLDPAGEKYIISHGEEVFLVSAESVSVTDGQLVFQDDRTAELIDFVDFVKIEQEADGVQEENKDNLELLGDNDPSTEATTFKKFEIVLQPNEKFKYKISAGGSSKLKLNNLIDKQKDIFIFEATFSNAIELTFGVVTDSDPLYDATVKEGKAGTLNLGRVEYPLGAGFEAYADVEVPINLEMEGEAEFVYELEQEATFKYDYKTKTWSESKTQDTKPHLDAEVNAKFETGIKMAIGIGFLESVVEKDEYTVSVSGKLSALFVVTLKAAGKLDDSGADHACTLCMDGNVDFNITLDVTLHFFITEKIQGDLLDVQVIKFTVHLQDFYFSIINSASSVHGGWPVFDEGKCPNTLYNVTVSATDMNGNAYSKPLKVTGLYEMSDGTEGTYQGDNTAKLSDTLQLHNGTYIASAEIGGISYARKLKVDGKPKSIDLLDFTVSGTAGIEDLGLALRYGDVTLFTFDGTVVGEMETGPTGKFEKTVKLPVGHEMLYVKIEQEGLLPCYAGVPIPTLSGEWSTGYIPAEYTLGRSGFTGMVQDAEGRALSDVIVELYDANGMLVYTAKTDELGVYRFATTLASGQYRLNFVKAGYTCDQVLLVIQIGSTQITEHTAVTMKTAGEEEGYSVTGVVCDASGRPLQGVEVALLTSDLSYVKSTQTDSNGRFLIAQTGEYGFTLKYIKDGYSTIGNTYPAGTTDVGTVKLAETHTLKGTVFSSSGEVLEGATVVVLKADGSVYDWQYSEADGAFRFNVVTEGTYTISVTAETHEEQQRAVTVTGPVTEALFTMKKIVPELTVTHATLGDVLALAEQQDALGGIQLCNGAGNANWNVTGAKSITKNGNWFTISQTNNASGGIDLTITVTGKTLGQNNGTIIFTKEDGTIRTVKVYQKAYSVHGMVKDSAGPVVDAAVVVWNNEGFRSDTVYTAADGTFSLPVYDAWYSVTVTTEEYGEKTVDLTSSVNMCDVTVEILLEHPNGACGNNLIWTLDQNGVLSISGSGDMYDYENAASVPWYQYRREITALNLASGITRIGSYAFDGCQMTTVTLPSALEAIGLASFANTALTNIEIPEGVEIIDSYAFQGCEQLKTITIPASVTSIGSLNDVSGLADIIVNQGNENYTSVDGVLFSKDGTALLTYPKGRTEETYRVPDGVQRIGFMAFGNTRKLVNVVMPESMVSFVSVFGGCSGLRRMYFLGDMPQLDHNLCNLDVVLYYIAGKEGWSSPSVTDANGYVYQTATFDPDDMELGTYTVAQGDCGDGLTWELDSTETLTIRGAGHMKNYASYPASAAAPWYEYQSNIVELKVDEGVESLGHYAFYGCYNLKTLSLPESLRVIGNYVFDGAGLKEFVVPKNVSSIGQGALNCGSLKAILVDPENAYYEAEDGVLFTKNKVTLVKYPERKGDMNIEDDWHYVIPEGVKTVAEDAFTGAIGGAGGVSVGSDGSVWYVGLNSITFPASVTGIAWSDYNSQYSYVQDLYFEGAAPTDIAGYSFSQNAKAVIHFYGDQTDVQSVFRGGWTSSAWVSPTKDVYETICEDAFSTVYGTVTDDAGLPIEGVTVMLYDRYGMRQPVYDVSDADGAYHFQVTEAGMYRLELTMTGYEPYTGEVTIDTSVVNLDSIKLEENLFIATGTYNDIEWKLNLEGVMTVTGSGAADDSEWDPYRSQVVELNVESGVTAIKLSDSIVFVDGTMYDGYTSLETIRLADTVENLTMDKYGQWEGLVAFEVDEANQNYSSVDGILYNGDGSVLIKCPPKQTNTVIVIPDGVVTISANAFKRCGALEELQLSSGVKEIGAEAFYNAYSLKNVHISDTVETIAEDAFESCGGLVAFTVDEGNDYFCAVDGVLFNRDKTILLHYPRRKSDVTVYQIPSTVVSLPSGIESDCLTEIEIGRKVEDIGEGFTYCMKLERFKVNSLNTAFSEKDGILFDKNKETLFRYPCMKTDAAYTLPDTVVTIESSAFYNCDNLLELRLPASLDTLRANSMGYCDKLSSLYFYGNVPSNWERYALGYSVNSNLVLYYVEGMTGWTEGSWTDPNGTTYHTSMITP